jgi:hypothetical protein
LTLVFEWIKNKEIVEAFKDWKGKNLSPGGSEEALGNGNDGSLKKDGKNSADNVGKNLENKAQDLAGKNKKFDIVYDKTPLSNKFKDF